MSAPSVIDVDVIQQEALTDPELAKIRQELASDPTVLSKYQLEQGKLFY